MSLPADENKVGNVWCEICQLSLNATREAVHIGSQKHAKNAAATSGAPAEQKARAKDATGAKAATKGRPRKAASTEAAPAKAPPVKKAQAAPKKKAPAPTEEAAAKDIELPLDPQNPGNYWCGICKVSLAPARAKAHLETARHQKEAQAALNSAMRSMKVDTSGY